MFKHVYTYKIQYNGCLLDAPICVQTRKVFVSVNILLGFLYIVSPCPLILLVWFQLAVMINHTRCKFVNACYLNA